MSIGLLLLRSCQPGWEAFIDAARERLDRTGECPTTFDAAASRRREPGGTVGVSAHDCMQRALSRLERTVESTLAREAAERADREGQAEIAAPNAVGKRAAGD